MSLFRKTLEEAKIPTASSLMANMLALKILRIVPNDTYCDAGFLHLDIPIAGNRTVEVRYSIRIEHRRSYAHVDVGLPGNNDGRGYLSVELTREEQKPLIEAIQSLIRRSKERRALAKEADSQDAAMLILEGLI